MNDNVREHVSYPRKTFPFIQMAIVFAVYIPTREHFLKIHAETVADRSFAGIFLQKVSVTTNEAL